MSKVILDDAQLQMIPHPDLVQPNSPNTKGKEIFLFSFFPPCIPLILFLLYLVTNMSIESIINQVNKMIHVIHDTL